MGNIVPPEGGNTDLANATGTLGSDHGGTSLTDSGTDSTKFLGSDGSHGFVMATPAGGGSASPFTPAGFANVSTFTGWQDLAISPDGQYVYVAGTLGSGNGAVAQVKVADGTVTATVDLGATGPCRTAVSPDSAHIYVTNQFNTSDFWDLSSTGLAIVHHSTLAVAPTTTNFKQAFDLSPDGSIYAYISGAGDAKLYMINTATYAVTNQTMSHTAGNLTSVCFYNGSNVNVYVAHAGSPIVDLYAIGGAYTSSVNTTAGGTPAFNAMRSGINGNFFIADSGTNKAVIQVASGTPTAYSVNGSQGLCTNYLSPTAIDDGGDICYFKNSGSQLYSLDTNGYDGIVPLVQPQVFYSNGVSGVAVLPGASQQLFTLSGVNYPEVWSVPATLVSQTAPGTAGNLQVSSGTGNWIGQTVSGDITINGSGVTAIKSSVALAGNPTAATQTAGDNSTRIASTAYVDAIAANVFTSADQTITAAGALTLAHGLGRTPVEVWFALVNQSTEAGYTAGQVVFIGGSQTTSVVAVQNDGYSAIVDGTNLTIRYGSDASTFTIPNATTGAATAITNSKWKCRFFAR